MNAGHKVETDVDVGELIRRTRRAAAMTQQQIADRVGTTRNCVIRLEQGGHHAALDTALTVLEELGLEIVTSVNTSPKHSR